jgi:hypothetical protein
MSPSLADDTFKMQNDDADGAVNIFNPFTAYVDWS